MDLAKTRRFELLVLPHLDAAYSLAYWLTRSDSDAQDVVQESCIRAFKYFDSFGGDNARAWLLSIIRRTCYTWLERNRSSDEAIGLKEACENGEWDYEPLLAGGYSLGRDPEQMLVENRDKRRLRQVISALPDEHRQVIVLRELEELSYRDIAEVLGVPIGTVMSRLARARGSLPRLWRRAETRER